MCGILKKHYRRFYLNSFKTVYYLVSTWNIQKYVVCISLVFFFFCIFVFLVNIANNKGIYHFVNEENVNTVCLQIKKFIYAQSSCGWSERRTYFIQLSNLIKIIIAWLKNHYGWIAMLELKYGIGQWACYHVELKRCKSFQ